MSDDSKPPGPGGNDEDDEVRLTRADDARVLDAAGSLTFLGRDGRARVLPDESAELARAVLEELTTARTRAELRAALGERSGGVVEPGGATDELVELLLAAGVLREVQPPSATGRPGAQHDILDGGRRVVVGLTGAIGSANAPALVSALLARGYRVRVAMTRAATRFVRPEALEALTHAPVHRSLWSRDPSRPVPHLDLAGWADAVVVCPASATTLSRLARGDFSDVVAATALATSAPVLLAPSMNPAMLAAPSVQRNLDQLRDDGFLLVLPGSGREVADPPELRRPRAAAAPRTDVVVDLLQLVLARAGRASPPGEPPVPADAAAWEALHAEPPGGALPSWHDDGPDLDLLGVIAELAPEPRLALDIGTGNGANAAELAARGWSVVAVDVAPTALARAEARHPGARVAWLADDIASSRLGGGFDVALDRGCLHALPAQRHADYVTSLSRLLRPGALLALKVDAPGAPARRATHRFDEGRLRALFAGRFELVRLEPARFAPGDEQASAWLAVLRRCSEADAKQRSDGA